MSTTQIEEQLLWKFEKALLDSISETSDVAEADLDDIVKQKLLLRAIRHFDLQEFVTIQWYKDGDVLAELEHNDSKISVTNAGVENGPFPDEDEIVSFFIEEMEPSLEDDLIVEDRSEWLKDYYESNETRFADIYQIEMDIHLHIKNIRKACLRENTEDELPEELVETIEQKSMELKKELVRYPLFRNVPPYVTEFSRIAVDILTQFEDKIKRSDGDYDRYADVFSALNKFFYETVWEVIANRIGFYTAEGPNEQKVRVYRKGTLHVSWESFASELDRLREVCRENGIEINADIDRLPKLNPDENDLEALLDWEETDRLDDEIVA